MTGSFPQPETGATKGHPFVAASTGRPDLPPEAYPAEGWYGERAFLLLEDNANQMSYTGTNTWILREPGEDTCVIVDPGNHMQSHIDRIIETCAKMGATPVAILLTHTHDDHCECAEPLADMLGIPVFSLENEKLPVATESDDAATEETLRTRLRDVTLASTGLKLQTVWLPGHSLDSVGIILVDDKSMVSGDVIFGHSSTVLANGTLRQYMNTLDTMDLLVNEGMVETILTGHGHVIASPLEQIRSQRSHRLKRLDGLRKTILETNSADPFTLLRAVYSDIAPRLERPALRNIYAQLIYMEEIEDPCLDKVGAIPADPLDELLERLAQEQEQRAKTQP